MAAPVLTEEQKVKLVEWLTAGFSEPLIRALFVARGWRPIAKQSVAHYREQHREEIDKRARERLEAAYASGLAQREARIRALVQHAEHLRELIWLPDDKGKLWNEKAWRETLEDIAREMGHRRQGIDLEVSNQSDAELIAEATAVLAELGPAASGEAAE